MDTNKKHLKAPKFEITVVQMWNFNFIALKNKIKFHEKWFSPPLMVAASVPAQVLFGRDEC